MNQHYIIPNWRLRQIAQAIAEHENAWYNRILDWEWSFHLSESHRLMFSDKVYSGADTNGGGFVK